MFAYFAAFDHCVYDIFVAIVSEGASAPVFARPFPCFGSAGGARGLQSFFMVEDTFPVPTSLAPAWPCRVVDAYRSRVVTSFSAKNIQ